MEHVIVPVSRVPDEPADQSLQAAAVRANARAALVGNRSQQTQARAGEPASLPEQGCARDPQRVRPQRGMSRFACFGVYPCRHLRVNCVAGTCSGNIFFQYGDTSWTMTSTQKELSYLASGTLRADHFLQIQYVKNNTTNSYSRSGTSKGLKQSYMEGKKEKKLNQRLIYSVRWLAA